MEDLGRKWTRPLKSHQNFPPYDLGDEDIVREAYARTKTIERIYHKGHDLAWNGPEILKELTAKHGGIHFPEEKKEAFGKMASILLWGELAAWSVSADIALRLNDVEAKMAASSQVFDEARHFHTLREYLWQAGVPIQKLGGYSHQVLVTLLKTDNLLHKLVGMQLMIESTAVCLFKTIAEAELEPVLTDLLYYFERDEARHVGLGALMLPKILADLNGLDAAKLWMFQMRVNLLMVAGGLTMRETSAKLGIDQSAMQLQAFKMQREIFSRMHDQLPDEPRGRATKGLFGLNRKGQDRINAFLFPRDGAPEWHGRTMKTLIAAAKRGDTWLAKRNQRTI